MKTNYLTVVLLGVLLFFGACEDDQVDHPRLALKFQAVEQQDTLKSAGKMVFRTARMGVRNIAVRGDAGEGYFKGPYKLDLLDGTILRDLAAVKKGVYTGLKAETAPVTEEHYSIYIEARYTNPAGKTLPLVYHTDGTLNLEVSNEHGIKVKDNDILELTVGIDLEGLFRGVDLNAAAANDSGTLIINGKHNTSMAKKIGSQLGKHVKLNKERD
jgi:hypothetical protein